MNKTECWYSDKMVKTDNENVRFSKINVINRNVFII